MNVRQQLYKKYRLEGYSKYTSARKAGYSHNTAIAAKRNIEKRINMDYWLEQEGLTDRALAKHIFDGLGAMRFQACDIYIKKDENGKWILNENSNDFVEIEDWANRHKYLETALRILNKLKGDVAIDQSQHTHTTFIIPDKDTLKKYHTITETNRGDFLNGR